jgi:hypothetical protein
MTWTRALSSKLRLLSELSIHSMDLTLMLGDGEPVKSWKGVVGKKVKKALARKSDEGKVSRPLPKDHSSTESCG